MANGQKLPGLGGQQQPGFTAPGVTTSTQQSGFGQPVNPNVSVNVTNVIQQQLEEQIKKIGEGITKSMERFVSVIEINTAATKSALGKDLQARRKELEGIFASGQKVEDLFENIMEFKEYLEVSGESVEDFAKVLGDGGDAFKNTIEQFDKAREENEKDVLALKKAGLVVEQKILGDKFDLRIFSKEEVKLKQQEIIDKRDLIKQNEKDILRDQKRLQNDKSLNQAARDELKQSILDTSETITDLDAEIRELKDKGIKEVRKVNTGIFAGFGDSYREGREKFNKFTGAFLPGPINTAVGAFVDSVEQGVGAFMDLLKPITFVIDNFKNLRKVIPFVKTQLFAFGVFLRKTYKKLGKRLDRMLKSLRRRFSKLGRAIVTGPSRAFKSLGRAMKPVAGAFKAIAIGLKAMLFALAAAVAPLILKFAVLAGKILLVTLPFLLLGYGIYKLITEFDKIKEFLAKTFGPVLERVGNFLKKVRDALRPIADIFIKLKDNIVALIDKIKVFTKRSAEEQIEKGNLSSAKSRNIGELRKAVKEAGVKGTRSMREDALLRKADELGIDTSQYLANKENIARLKELEKEERDARRDKIKGFFKGALGKVKGIFSPDDITPAAAGAGTSANSTIVNDNRMNVDQSAVKNESYGGSSSSEIATEVKAIDN